MMQMKRRKQGDAFCVSSLLIIVMSPSALGIELQTWKDQLRPRNRESTLRRVRAGFAPGGGGGEVAGGTRGGAGVSVPGDDGDDQWS